MIEIVFVSGFLIPASGGAEISMYSLLKLLSTKGYNITVITRKLSKDSTYIDNHGKNFRVIRIADSNEIKTVLDQLNQELRSKFILFTQNSWCKPTILYGRQHSIPIFLFLRSPSGNLDVGYGGKLECTYIVANSKSTLTYAKNHYGRKDAIFVPSFVFQEKYKVSYNTEEFITIINPIISKGGYIFKKIAQTLPNIKFLAVKGWGHLKNNGKWNDKLIQELSEGNGVDQIDDYFYEVSFKKNSNVSVMNPVNNMREVYSKTKILLVPSIADEGGPRVATEALTNGIPVIASSKTNLHNLLKKCGTIIDDYLNINVWVSEIRNLLDEKVYAEISKKSYKTATNLPKPKELIQPLLNVLEQYQS